MASDLITAEALLDAVNGADSDIRISADAAMLEARIDEMDAYIVRGWGPHPTLATDAGEFYMRRQCLILLVVAWLRGDYSAAARAEATSRIRYRSS